ncbi:MAG: hypothetical protein JWP10_86 [Nocardioidaceae bacterium]|nr:hypothetical protein [Nocardioidaceae bacterium]
MTTTTTMLVAVFVLAFLNFCYKASGPVILGDRPLPPSFKALIDALPAALLAALITINLLGARWEHFDWRFMPGLAAAAALRLLGIAQIVCILVAVVGTAGLRALT